jgi:hypothetical protein
MFGDEMSLIVAFAIGIGFGFFLERAGFASARKLMAQFYLHDLAVFKVMFSAIVTATLGVTYLAWMRVLDLSLVYLTPTYVLPQLVGGLVFGVGFVVGGYCPGTSVASIATGKIDALLFAAGMLAGTVAFAELRPHIGGFFTATSLGEVTIPRYFGLPYGAIVFAVVLMALGGFYGAVAVERLMARREVGRRA